MNRTEFLFLVIAIIGLMRKRKPQPVVVVGEVQRVWGDEWDTP